MLRSWFIHSVACDHPLYGMVNSAARVNVRVVYA